MKIREAVYKEAQVTKRVLVEPELYGCDHCGKEISNNPSNELKVTVFHTEHESKDLEFCSWGCVLSHLPQIKTNHFITLPYVSFDLSDEDKAGANHLIDLLKKSGLAK